MYKRYYVYGVIFHVYIVTDWVWGGFGCHHGLFIYLGFHVLMYKFFLYLKWTLTGLGMAQT